MPEFDEVVSKSATETEYGSQPLGDIAAIGRGGKPLNDGHVHYQCEEPGYIMGLMAITPMVDYSQGNDFDLNLHTIDDLHKPASDGIGYQDSVKWQRAFWDRQYNTTGQIQQPAVGKTVAWINYMTNINRTFGNFADNNSEAFMVMNRQYSPKTNSDGHLAYRDWETDRKSTRLNSSHITRSRMPSSA